MTSLCQLSQTLSPEVVVPHHALVEVYRPGLAEVVKECCKYIQQLCILTCLMIIFIRRLLCELFKSVKVIFQQRRNVALLKDVGIGSSESVTVGKHDGKMGH